ncbi:MAG TPA: nucleotide exchange factor GrpE [Anaerolineales bacterium]|nr:nucleotide exchange factor GrpE [Anaerolineales bacterium]
MTIDESERMTEKKKHKHEKEQAESEIEENKAEAVSTSEDTEQLSAEIESLKKQLAEAESKTTEYKDSWLRSQAEFQNFRRRMERDSEMMHASMKGDIVKKVLPVLDDLERALQNRSADDPWANGIELVARKFQNILESEGVKKIEARGKEFDPNFHEAISHEPADGAQSGHVIGVVQNGYMIGERVIRPALVRVAQ